MKKVVGRRLYVKKYDDSFNELDNACCEQMDFYIAYNEHPILYLNKFREYAIECSFDWDGNGVIQDIQYCPFCGKKLPKSLRTRWYNVLKKLGINDPVDKNIPEEFQDDTWWKNKGL